MFEFSLSEERKVFNIKVIEKTGMAAFARDSRKALQQTRFIPTVFEGKPAQTDNVRFSYALKYADSNKSGSLMLRN